MEICCDVIISNIRHELNENDCIKRLLFTV